MYGQSVKASLQDPESPTTVVGYVRVSTEEQAKSDAGLEAQRHAIKSECDRRGWTLLALYGAELILTPAIEGMSGAVFAAEALVRQYGYFMPQQFLNPANPEIHRRTTAREILDATDGELDAIVVGVGTGGTITGVGEVLKTTLKATRPNLLVVAVEPSRAAVLSGGRPAPHGIQGIGAGFIPGVLNREIVDRVIAVTDEDALSTARRLVRMEGILVGISSGANVFAAIQIARELGPGRVVVTILADTGERYLTTFQAGR